MANVTTTLFREWLEADGLLGHIDDYSHASCALATDASVVEELNRLARGSTVEWYPGVYRWPENDWIIGESGSGDLYLVAASDPEPGVWEYDHETREKRLLAPSLREFYEFCIRIERERGAAA